MTSAVVYLTVHSVRNRLAWQAGRLGSLRYLLVLLLGGGYVWFVLAGPSTAAPQRLPIGPWLEVVGAVGLTLVILRWWLLETEQVALAFSPAEVQFLFPAPVSRRGLIHFKLLRAQFALLLNTVIWTVFLRPGVAGTSPWPRAIALWILFSTLFLHRLG
ncbi:MAG: putative ABC exporter domain-containing protein, partial [Gemmatimonadales bacterium]